MTDKQIYQINNLINLLPKKYKKKKFLPVFEIITNSSKDGNFDKIGGIPAINKNFKWPKCSACKNYLKFVFQITISKPKTIQLFMCFKCQIVNNTDTRECMKIRETDYNNCMNIKKACEWLKKYDNEYANIRYIQRYAYNYYDGKELIDSRNYKESLLYKTLDKSDKYLLIDWSDSSQAKRKQLQCYKINHFIKDYDIDCNYDIEPLIKKFESERKKKNINDWTCTCREKEKAIKYAEKKISTKINADSDIQSLRYQIKPLKPNNLENGSYLCECFEDLFYDEILEHDFAETFKIKGIGMSVEGITYDSLISFSESKFIPYQFGDNGCINIMKDLQIKNS